MRASRPSWKPGRCVSAPSARSRWASRPTRTSSRSCATTWRRRRRRLAERVAPATTMISFVVPAYNEEKYLAATLASIHEAARCVGEPYEIVVANDASTDATAATAQAGGARVVNVEKRQIAATRNAGARASTGEILIFVDADTRIDVAVVRAAL